MPNESNVTALPARNKELIEMLKQYLEKAEKGVVTTGVMCMFTADGQYEIATSGGVNKFVEGGVLVAAGLQKMGFVTGTMQPAGAK